MDAAMLERVLKLLGQAQQDLREAQSAVARGQASVILLQRLAGELEQQLEKAVR